MSREPAVSCIRCGYDLSGLATGATCPECGAVSGDEPALVGGAVSREDLSYLSRAVVGAALLNLASAVLQMGACVLAMYDVRELSIIPLLFALFAEVGVALFTAETLRTLRRLPVGLGRALFYGTITATARVPMALAVVVPMVVWASRGGKGHDPELFVYFAGILAALGTICIQAVFLQDLVRGVASGKSRRRAEDLATINIVTPLITIGLSFCMIGLVIFPAVYLLGACLNAAIARVFHRAVRNCRPMSD